MMFTIVRGEEEFELTNEEVNELVDNVTLVRNCKVIAKAYAFKLNHGKPGSIPDDYEDIYFDAAVRLRELMKDFAPLTEAHAVLVDKVLREFYPDLYADEVPEVIRNQIEFNFDEPA